MFKTRSLATDVCKAGKVKIKGKSVKPSYIVSIGDEVHFTKEGDKKILVVKQIIEKRTSATLAVACYEDLSPPTETKEIMQSAFMLGSEFREKGIGRPTKKERRKLDNFKNLED